MPPVPHEAQRLAYEFLAIRANEFDPEASEKSIGEIAQEMGLKDEVYSALFRTLARHYKHPLYPKHLKSTQQRIDTIETEIIALLKFANDDWKKAYDASENRGSELVGPFELEAHEFSNRASIQRALIKESLQSLVNELDAEQKALIRALEEGRKEYENGQSGNWNVCSVFQIVADRLVAHFVPSTQRSEPKSDHAAGRVTNFLLDHPKEFDLTHDMSTIGKHGRTKTGVRHKIRTKKSQRLRELRNGRVPTMINFLSSPMWDWCPPMQAILATEVSQGS